MSLTTNLFTVKRKSLLAKKLDKKKKLVEL